MNELITPTGHLPSLPYGKLVVPLLVAQEGERAAKRYVEFFAANIRNRNTRRAYARAAADFLGWCERRALTLPAIEPVHVAAYVEQLLQTGLPREPGAPPVPLSPPSVKQQLAAIRMLFDWFVVGQIVPHNPASSVRGPKHVVARGKTPVLPREDAKALIDAIETDTLIGVRDRALIGTLLYTFARIEAALQLNVGDYFSLGKRGRVRLHEKGGKVHEMPVHHALEELLDAYLAAAGIEQEKKGPLFRTAPGRTRDRLTANRLQAREAYGMIRRRALAAGIDTNIGCHSWRAIGITNYLENGGTLEHAQQMAAHSSPRTTKLYDRTKDEVTLTEVERIRL
ncbi:tyrosine-type recombinase/integrase [Roseicella aquatilis]|uniref:Integrase n=1 Tax=Roseicella aquatilis TaxID=2527868 RepID=A0A4R4D7P8_9PROT|nr:tyrosine-type recombinase/integrase [Roseicella aquatilis]TCZ55766.1 integrase [Roseicella aquatilis]